MEQWTINFPNRCSTITKRGNIVSMKSKNNFIFLLVFLFVTGCASFSGKHLPIIEYSEKQKESTNKNEKDNKPDLLYTFSSGFEEKDHTEKVTNKLEKELISEFSESGYLISELKNNENSDDETLTNIEVRLTESRSRAAVVPAFFTGISFYLIPSWATDNYTINAQVKEYGKKVRIYKIDDSMTTIQWLPLIVVSPFKNMFSVSKEVRKNMWRNLILKMQDDNVLP